MNEFRLSDANYEKDGIEYTINEKIGRIDANLYGVDNNVLSVLNKIITYNSKYLDINLDAEENGDLVLPNMYHAKSKANLTAGEIFNETIGKNKAHDRCMAKYHRNFDSCMNKFVVDVRTLLGALEYYCDKTGIDTSELPSVDEIRNKRFNG